MQMGYRENLTVRRLTPIECERLQGFPDNWTSEKMELILEGNEWKVYRQGGQWNRKGMVHATRRWANAVTVNVAEFYG